MQKVSILKNFRVRFKVNDKYKSFRESIASVYLFYVSLLVYLFLPTIRYTNSLGLNLTTLVGFSDYWSNLVVLVLAVSFLVHLIYAMIFSFISSSTINNLREFLDKNRITKYLYFWFGVRNFVVGAFRIIEFFVPTLIVFDFFVNIVLSLAAVTMCFSDLKKHVYTDVFAGVQFGPFISGFYWYYTIVVVFEVMSCL